MGSGRTHQNLIQTNVITANDGSVSEEPSDAFPSKMSKPDL
jgi:hypothetical protein